MSNELITIVILDEEQYEKIEQLAGANYSPEDIASYLKIDRKQFVDEYNKENSKIRYHYNRGQLVVRANDDIQLYESAKSGNITAYNQLEKAKAANKLEQVKKKHMLAIEKIKTEKLQFFMQTKHKGELDADLSLKYEQLDLVRSLWQKGHAKNYIINALFSSFPKLSYYKARIIFDEAINFFYLDSDIKKQSWRNYYADQLEIMAKICMDMNDFNQARLLIREASEMRELHLPEKEDKEAENTEPVVIYTLEPENLGLAKANRKRLAEFIDNLEDITESGRDRLHMEAMDGKSEGNILNIDVEEVEYLADEKSDEADE